MDDAALVVALRDGDLAAFGRIYDRYADRLHAYAVTLLGDRDAASDAVHDAFLLAHDRIGQLRDPALLRPWLYAITRSQAQRVLRQRGRSTDLEAAAEMTDDEVRWDRSLDADEARLLVLAALSGLNPGDRSIIELSLRHELDTAELARVLGQSSSHTSALVSRAKQQFDGALTAVLLMRTRGRDCPALRSLIGDESTLTPLLRKRIGRHAKDCASCSGNRRAAIAVLPGVALALPFEGAPDALRARLVSGDGALLANTRPRVPGDTPQLLDGEGFPVTETSMRRRWIVAAVVAGVLAFLLVALIGGRVLGSDAPAPPSTVPATTEVPAARPAASPTSTPLRRTPAPSTAPAPTSGVGDTGAQGSSGSGGPVSAPRSTARASAAPTRAPPVVPPSPRPTPTVSVAWSDLDPSTCASTFDLRITASVSGASISRATATWRATIGSGSASVALVRTSSQGWQGVLSAIPGASRPELTVTVVTPQGVRVTTPAEPVTDSCGG